MTLSNLQSARPCTSNGRDLSEMLANLIFCRPDSAASNCLLPSAVHPQTSPQPPQCSQRPRRQNFDLVGGPVCGVRLHVAQPLQGLHAAVDAPKNGVLPVEPRRGSLFMMDNKATMVEEQHSQSMCV